VRRPCDSDREADSHARLSLEGTGALCLANIMRETKPTAMAAEDRQSFAMVRRLLAEHARQHIVAYAIALLLMSLTAGATVLSVSLLRPIVNGMTDFNVAEGGAFGRLRFLALDNARRVEKRRAILRRHATRGQ